MCKLFVLDRNTWYHNSDHMIIDNYNCKRKDIKAMEEWKYSYDYIESFTNESNFSIK